MTQQFDPMAAVRTHWRLLPLLALMGALLLGTFYFLQPPRYTSTATVQYSHQDPTAGLTGQQANYGDPERTLATQRDIVLSDRVLAPVVEATSMSRPDLLSALRVSTETGNDVLRISAEDTSAARASQLAKAVVDAYVNHNRALGKRQLEAQAEALTPLIADLQPRTQVRPRENDVVGQAQVSAAVSQLATLVQQQQQLRAARAAYQGQASVLAVPEVPRAPSSPSWPWEPPWVLVLGLGLALLVALIKGSIRQRRYDPDDLSAELPELQRPPRVVRRPPPQA
jgi:uncharacterized protein involved in exopolysaccharide biosynthesis